MQAAGLTDLVAAIERGELTAHAAAAEMGWIKRPPSSGGSPNVVRRRQLAVYRLAQAGAFKQRSTGPDPSAGCPIDLALVNELWLGPNDSTFFSSRDELRRTWEESRTYLLATFGRPGRRPMAWWEFDASAAYPGYDRERSTLWRMDVLDAEEKAVLEREWRDEFARAYAPGFSIARPFGEEPIAGAAARKMYFAHCDIPIELIQAWTGERLPRRRKAAAPELEDDGSDSVELGPRMNGLA
jgi:hypothetical protein